MARVNVARQSSDNFQFRLFWLKAASLLDEDGTIRRVAYELGPKGFDDFLVEYEAERAPQDDEGNPILREHSQCKWDSTPGAFGHADLTDPQFLQSGRTSFLHRALAAQKQFAPEGRGFRSKLVTNWRLRPEDPLAWLVRRESQALDAARLFDASDTYQGSTVRKLWREHLRVSEAELQRVARMLAFAEAPDALQDVRERLDERLAYVGLKRMPLQDAPSPYDALLQKLYAQGRGDFDRKSFRELCQRESLFESEPRPLDTLTLGIRSLPHPFDNLEDRCSQILDLVQLFSGRYLRGQADWREHVQPALEDFIKQSTRNVDKLRFIIEAHASLAFAAGVLVGVKPGRRIEFEQRGGGRRFWTEDDTTVEMEWPRLAFEEEALGGPGEDVAVAISLTSEVSESVRAYVKQHLPGVKRLMHCHPNSGPSRQAVRSGRHAWLLSDTLSERLRPRPTPDGRRNRLHLFMAAPNAFAFYLGQHQRVLGHAVAYEYNLENERNGTWAPGLEFGQPKP